MKKILLYVFIGVLLVACESSQEPTIYLSEDYPSFPYDIDKPDVRYELPYRLREISGLTYHSDTSLLCVNDEEGVVFDYDMKNREIAGVYSFGKKGDYEGVELVDNILYVLRSNGDIYAVKNFNTDAVRTVRYKTLLNSKTNTEGLGYDKNMHSLLIACKGQAAPQYPSKGIKAIYSFSLNTFQLSEKPVYNINLRQVGNIIAAGNNREADKKDCMFKPSAVAVHPISKNLYVLASAGKKMLVLNSHGDILAIIKLKPTVFYQPEGLCFAPDGTMFICNEAKEQQANILKFCYSRDL